MHSLRNYPDYLIYDNDNSIINIILSENLE
jgi:hypothetical protein